MASETPMLLSPIVAKIMADEGISREQISGWEVVSDFWIVDIKGVGSYTVDINKKEIVNKIPLS